MIEVEKKFILNAAERAALIDGATPLGMKTFTDVYYDNADYDLTKKDWWLRSRDGRFELKIPADKVNRDVETNQYEELEQELDIKKRLNIAGGGALQNILPAHGYHPFVTMTTTREKFRRESFIIDFDTVDFGFAIAEIEMMVSDKSEIEAAKKKVFSFAEGHGLVVKPVRGKVLEYLHRNSPEHLKALEEAWGVKL